MKGRSFATLLLLVTLLALGMRLYRLGDPSLWSDEMFQVRDSLQVWNAGYLPTRLGMQLSGVSTEALAPDALSDWSAAGLLPRDMRLGSALVGALTVPLLALACAPWLSRRTALLLALLLATNPWHLEWSQQARHYTPIFLYSNLALVLYWGSIRSSSQRWLAAALLLAFLAVASRATALMVFGVIGLDALVETVRRRRLALSPAVIAWVALAVAACAGLLLVRSLGPGPGGASQQAEFLARGAGQSPLKLVAGNVVMSGVPLVVLAAMGFLARFRQEPREALYLAWIALVPLLCFGGLAFFAHVEIRYSFPNLFGWLVLAAIGVVALYDAARQTLPRAVAAAPLLVLLASQLLAAAVYYESAYGNRPRWNHAFAYLGRHWKPGDAVYAHSSWAGQYYLASDRVRNVDLDFQGLESLDRDTWFVVKSTAWDRGEGRPHWLDGKALLRAAYPTRVAFPQDTVRVYYYDHEARR